jgi:hypothetical protein
MKRQNIINTCIVTVLSLVVIFCLSVEMAATESYGEKPISKELEKDIGLPILDGNLWGTMTQDSKVAFIWGIWHVVSTEHYLMSKYPDLKKDNFCGKVIEATSSAPVMMNQVVAHVDKYYQVNPDQSEKPVLAVIWSTMIKPNIKTGINGRPLH